MSTDLGSPPILSPEEADRALLLAAPRGYCAGVDRAVVTVEKALDLYGAPVYVRKQIVHNKHVVSDLESRGAIFVEELDEVPAGETVVFSAHGVSPEVHRQAEERELKTIDATCPLVTKVHHEAKRFAGDDYDILLIGHEGHEEVEGTAGEAPDHIQLVQGPERRAPHRGARPVTGRLALPDHAVGRRDDGDGGRDPEAVPRAASTRPATTSATPPRTGSSRSRRSRSTPTWSSSWGRATRPTPSGWSRSRWRPAPRRRTASTTRPRSTRPGSTGSTTVSVTSGASVPEELVEGVLEFLAERGYPDARAVHSAEESLIFALPKELRRDLKAAGRH